MVLWKGVEKAAFFELAASQFFRSGLHSRRIFGIGNLKFGYFTLHRSESRLIKRVDRLWHRLDFGDVLQMVEIASRANHPVVLIWRG